MQLQHQKMQDLLLEFYQSEEIKEDEYMQKLFNKCVMYINYFDELKSDIESI